MDELKHKLHKCNACVRYKLCKKFKEKVENKVADRPDQIGVYVGGGGDISGYRYLLLDLIYRISSFTSFVGIWLTTAILMTSYREKIRKVITYWIIMLIPACLFYYYLFLSAYIR